MYPSLALDMPPASQVCDHLMSVTVPRPVMCVSGELTAPYRTHYIGIAA